MSNEPGTNRPVWDAEATHPEDCERIREALGQVNDPEIGLSVIQLGLIRNVTITDELTIVKMILTTPFCPYGPALIYMVRAKAEEAMSGSAVSIELGMDVWDFSMMDENVDMDWGLY